MAGKYFYLSRVAMTRCSVSMCLSKATLCLGLLIILCACNRPVSDAGAQVQKSAVAKAIWVTPGKVHLEVGQSLHFSATISDSAGNILEGRTKTPTLQVGPLKQTTALVGDSVGRTGKVLFWKSNDPSLVSVDGEGLVTALAVGIETITVTFEDQSRDVEVIVSDPQSESLSVSPIAVNLVVGESLLFTTISKSGGGDVPNERIFWSVDPPSRATINANGFLTATAVGEVTISAKVRGDIATANLNIAPGETISGLDFPGSARVSKTMRFEFKKPLTAFPATYIWHAYPRQQESYYTAFFWGNNGAFYPSKTYYGFHPYPDWNSAYQHFWEIASPPGGDFVNDTHVVYDRWYTQVAICRISGTSTVQEFYWDWPDISKVVRHTGKLYKDPPVPVLAIGDAPWNHGHEVWDGVLRGFQLYNTALTTSEIAQEIKSPGSVKTLWCLNLNPTPKNILDQSGNSHHPGWVGTERPLLWQGAVRGDTAIRTVVSPR